MGQTNAPFQYKILLIDDKLTAHALARQMEQFGVVMHTRPGIEDFLAVRFGDTPLSSVRLEDALHDYDVILLDYDLAAPDRNYYPNMGLAIYPYFVHAYDRNKRGSCIVRVYSSALDSAYPRYRDLFVFSERLRTGSADSYVSGPFDNLQLGPLIKDRAESLLRACPGIAIREVYDTVVRAQADPGAMDASLGHISIMNGSAITLGRLRPDVGRSEFYPGGDVSTVRDLLRWLRTILFNTNYCTSACRTYHTPHILSWAHDPDPRGRQNDPWQCGAPASRATVPNALRFLHPQHLDALREVTYSDQNERRNKVHRAFRLSLVDSELRHGPPFDKGYFLNDLAAGQSFCVEPRSVGDDSRENYVYIPLTALRALLADLAERVGVVRGSYKVNLCGSDAVAFSLALETAERVRGIRQAIDRVDWRVKTDIRDWGELVLREGTGAGQTYAVIGDEAVPVALDPGTYPFPVPSMSLLFPISFSCRVCPLSTACLRSGEMHHSRVRSGDAI